MACTLDAFRLLEPLAGDHRLQSICDRRGIAFEDAHDALSDVLATTALLRLLLDEGIAPETVELDQAAFLRLRSRGDTRPASERQIRRVFGLARSARMLLPSGGVDRTQVVALVQRACGTADVDSLTREQVQDVYDALERVIAMRPAVQARMTHLPRLLLLGAIIVLLGLVQTAGAAQPPPGGQLSRIARVVDGDTVNLTDGARVRLVQIDTPEVYYSPECYGEQASAVTKRLLPPGTLVRLYREPKTDAVDQYGRLLRYVFRVRDGLNVNIQLVRVGRCGAVLLRLPARPLREPVRATCPPRTGTASRPLGTLPAHPLRPQSRRLNRTRQDGLDV